MGQPVSLWEVPSAGTGEPESRAATAGRTGDTRTPGTLNGVLKPKPKPRTVILGNKGKRHTTEVKGA